MPTASATPSPIAPVARECMPSRIVCSGLGCLYANGDWTADSIAKQEGDCAQGKHAACTSLGVRLSLGEGVKPDDKRAKELLDRSCAQSDALACVNATKLRHKETFEGWVKMCEAGVGEACLEAGNDIRFGSAASTHTPADGAAYYAHACDMGIGNACARLAYHAGTGLAMPRDDKKMFTFFDKACRCEDDTGCSGVAYSLREGRGTPKDLVHAFQMFEALCNRKIEASCVHLGRMYELGEGVPLDLTQALAIYKAACDDSHRDPEGAQGCYMLGQAYRDGRGVVRDEPHAFRLFDEGCREKEALSCGEQGRWYRDGRTVPRDTTHALELLDFACSHGDNTSCRDADAMRAGP